MWVSKLLNHIIYDIPISYPDILKSKKGIMWGRNKIFQVLMLRAVKLQKQNFTYYISFAYPLFFAYPPFWLTK